MTSPPSFENSYSPASDWTTSTTPKTQSATTASGSDLILVLGGTEDSTTTLGTPTDGSNTYTLQRNSLVASTCAGYSWSTGAAGGQLAVTTSSLPGATVSTPYTAGLAATGGTGAGYAWSVTSGALPSWATLTASTGVIAGTPNAAGTASFTVQVADSGGNKASKPLSITTTSGGSAQPVGPGGTWTLVFEDQFPGTSLNTANWTAPSGISNSNAVTNPAQVSVSGGYCRLLVNGMINSKPSIQGWQSGGPDPANGVVLNVGDCCEARINWPGPSGDTAYNWPAWWVSGASWPANGEEDIFESYNGTPSALNYHNSSGANNGPFPSGSWCNSEHVYTLVRGQATLDCYWDGVLVRSVARNDSGGPQSLIVFMAVGNQASSTAAGLVKYVRMWTPG